MDRAVAFALAAAVHVALVGAWLSWSRDADTPVAGGDALQVVWIERPRPVAPAPPPARAIPSDAKPSAVRAIASTTPAAAVAAPDAEPSPDPGPSRALSAVFVEQGRALARAQHGHDFTRNPLVDPQPVRIDATPERIRMRDPLTPARIVAGIGLLFGGAGYETDPCPRIRRNLGELVTAGRDDPGLQEELRRHRQFCQQ